MLIAFNSHSFVAIRITKTVMEKTQIIMRWKKNQSMYIVFIIKCLNILPHTSELIHKVAVWVQQMQSLTHLLTSHSLIQKPKKVSAYKDHNESLNPIYMR